MGRRRLRISLWVLCLVSIFVSSSLYATSHEISIVLEAAGTALLDLPGFVLSGSLAGELRASGSLFDSGRRTDFEGEGDFVGTGYRDLLSFDAEAWASYRVRGRTSDGEPIALSGLLYLHRTSSSLLRIGEVLTGIHYVLITIGESETSFLGDFSGSLTEGSLVLPGAGGLMALAGGGSFHLTGASAPYEESSVFPIPLPAFRWAQSFAEHVRTLFPQLQWP
jgi:hypothetical protein